MWQRVRPHRNGPILLCNIRRKRQLQSNDDNSILSMRATNTRHRIKHLVPPTMAPPETERSHQSKPKETNSTRLDQIHHRANPKGPWHHTGLGRERTDQLAKKAIVRLHGRLWPILNPRTPLRTRILRRCSNSQTYQRGKGKIDHILCTPRILDCIQSVTIEAFNGGIVSDHRALIIDLNTNLTFGNNAISMARRTKRILKSTNVKVNSLYRNELHNRLMQQNVFKRSEKILQQIKNGKSNETIDQECEQMDGYITKCMVASERASQWRGMDSFSPTTTNNHSLHQQWMKSQKYVKILNATVTKQLKQ